MLALFRPDIAAALAEAGFPAYRHAQVYEHLFRRPSVPFSEASSLPVDLRGLLDGLGTGTLEQVEERSSADGTTKLLLSCRDGARIETVLMRYQGRMTVCISSQVGCAVGCLFCATGGLGPGRNLTVAEIVDQVRAASAVASTEQRRVSNVVYMGMGEPLLNLQVVLESIRVLTDPNGGGISHRALSVSTIGIPSGILRLGRTEPQVNLAVSLHAPDDVTRALLVPARFRHPISEILGAAWDHFALTHRKLLVEYVLLRGINDSPEQARALAHLLRGHVATVNLLAWNPVRRRAGEAAAASGARACPPGRGPGVRGDLRSLGFQPSPPAAVAIFRETLLSSHIETVVRRSKGVDIEGACGQLAGRRRCEDDMDRTVGSPDPSATAPRAGSQGSRPLPQAKEPGRPPKDGHTVRHGGSPTRRPGGGKTGV